MRVLLAGFGRFPGAPFNPSADLVQKLARRRRPALHGISCNAHVFATSYASVDHDLPQLFAAKPDVVLIFGLAGRRRDVCIETRARNAMSVVFPDASGLRPVRSVIAPGAPSALSGQAPFARLVAAVRASKVPARMSRDAGRYLCNYAYWRALERARNSPPLVQFVHIPAIRRDARPLRHGPSKRHALTLGALVVAAENLLIALVAAGKR
jgi:pyroglutamyl-peptidase